jgi:hypothetical protein
MVIKVEGVDFVDVNVKSNKAFYHTIFSVAYLIIFKLITKESNTGQWQY